MPASRTAEPPHHVLPLPDGSLHYTQAGSGAGAPILLIHGSLCDYRYWRWQTPAFADRHLVIAPSLRGCWPDRRSHPQDGYAITRHASDLAHLLRALDAYDGAHVVGHSRGAQVALALACQAPELCRSLTLADPGFRFTDEPETPVFYADAVQRLQDGDTEGAIEQFIDTVNGADTWRKMVGWFKDMVRDNATTLLSQVREANLPVDPQAAAALPCPVLLVGGALSPAKYGTRLDRLQQLLPQARRARIALAAHGMNLANPRTFNRTVLEFVAGV
ncbi:MAG: alpha/beta hydrolase [Castellaniella sp.]|uniref:alpha/beta fold hydrolase n=1 Tax=Castellaniella sp. TaxID=1955812 RepID=UPI002A35B435|nr:alpha/beta hydrolase [Castellaniella sp.]MDY0309207.1 alpha/beta hydrolase [Castellaniella sp.]